MRLRFSILLTCMLLLFSNGFAETKQAKIQAKTTYKLYHRSNRVAVVYVWDGDRIAMRQGFAYSPEGVIVIEVNDDGYADDINDLSGVTYRQIRYITPNPKNPFGPSLKIEEKVLDLSTGHELLERAYHHHFSPQGHLIKQEIFDANKQLVATLEWEYDTDGRVIRRQNQLGDQIVYLYDNKGNCTLEHGPRKDKHKENLYDGQGRLIQENEVYPDTTLSKKFRYDSSGRMIAEIDHYGHEKNYIYDSSGCLTQIIEPLVLDETGKPVRPTTTFSYNEKGQPYLKKDPKGHIVKAAFDPNGKISELFYQDGSEEKFEYSPHGELTKHVLRNGCFYRYIRDYQDRVVSTGYYSSQGSLLWQTSAEYNAFHLVSETDALGHVTYYDYDVFDRLIKKEKLGQVTCYEYDAQGRVNKKMEKINDDEMVIYCYQYNALNQLEEEKTIRGNECFNHKKYFYDPEGNLVKEMHFNGNEKEVYQTIYTSTGKQVIEPCGQAHFIKNHYSYVNQLGQCVPCEEVIDSKGCTTFLIKDALGRLVEITKKDPFGNTLQKKKNYYDLLGCISREIETVFHPDNYRTENVTQYEYDSELRCIAKIEKATSIRPLKTHYTYNILGQLICIEKPAGKKIKYNYNSSGLVQAVYANDLSVFYTFNYDKKQRLISVKDELTQKVLTRSYDAFDQLVEEKLPTGLGISYQYDAAHNVTLKTLSDQTKIKYQYAYGLLKAIERLDADDTILYVHSYDQYDKMQRPTTETMLDRAGKCFYKYGKQGFLKSITSKHYKEYIPRDGWDPKGNLLKRTILDCKGKHEIFYQFNFLNQLISEFGASFRHTFKYDSLSKLVSVDDQRYAYNLFQQLAEDREDPITYDLDGNITSIGLKTFSYDALGRLVKAGLGDTQVEYAYDAFNRRLSKFIYTPKDEIRLDFLYDHHKEVGCYENGEPRELAIPGDENSSFPYVAIELRKTPYAIIYDVLGNVSTILNHTGAVHEAYRFSKIGEEEVFDRSGITKNAENPWRFGSMRFEKETGFYFNGHQYYNPQIGHWLTRKPDRIWQD
ncbi:MAG: hypothetical protein ACSNEK_03735 [Parachlamydiaceae bacterium]